MSETIESTATIIQVNDLDPEPEETMGAALVPRLGAAMSPAEVDKAVELVQAQVNAQKRIKAALISLTNPRQWVEMKAESGGEPRPYLEEDGAIRLIHPLGVELEVLKLERLDYPDGSFEYVYHGRARATSFSQAWLTAVGSRWSGDGFYTRGRDQREARIDPGDVRKGALTNFRANAIKAVTGLDGCTWDELSDAGIDRDRVTRITYKGNSSANRQLDSKAAKEKLDTTVTEAGEMQGEGRPGAVLSHSTREGDGKKGPWLLTIVELENPEGDRMEATTFDTKVGGVLLQAKDTDTQVLVWLKQNGERTNVVGAKLTSKE